MLLNVGTHQGWGTPPPGMVVISPSSTAEQVTETAPVPEADSEHTKVSTEPTNPASQVKVTRVAGPTLYPVGGTKDPWVTPGTLQRSRHWSAEVLPVP